MDWYLNLLEGCRSLRHWRFRREIFNKNSQEPKNSLIKQYQRLFEFEEVELEFNDDAISEIARKAIAKKTGARGLRSILENILLKTMFELPDMENVIKVTVDKAAVKGASEPIVTYGKKSSTSVA